MATDIEINTLKGWPNTSSTNSSRATSVHSDISSTIYAKWVQALANNPTWAHQVKISKSEGLALFYATPKIGDSNNVKKTIAIENTLEPYSLVTNNMYKHQGLDSSAILYLINQLTELQLWNGSFCPIFIFGMNEYLEGDAKNIVCSLYRIAAFIRQYKIENKTAEEVMEFGFVAWDFISSIYKSVWDKLTAYKDNISFR